MKQKFKKPELLAPAGDLNKLKTALAHGADAVFFGVPDFSLRVRINDFDFEGLKEGIELAHSIDKKAYITLNIFAHNKHLKNLERHIKQLKILKPDALFISDPGILETVRQVWPEAKISLSTQANCINWQAVKFWRAQGIKRIILGRELSLKEIQEIIKKIKNTDTEIEIFVHGALCAAYSGRCFMSDYLIGRSANLGDCVQPCRWEYEIKPLGHTKSLILGEDQNGSYLMNSQDLCLIKRLPEIIRSGVSALKIEGRAKSVYYLANVVGVYRKSIDLICDNDLSDEDIKKELNFLHNELETKLSHRGYSEGFMFRDEKNNLQNTSGKHFIPNWEFCGQVLKCEKDKNKGYRLIIKVHNTLRLGDELEIIGQHYKVGVFKLKEMFDLKTGENLNETHGGKGDLSDVIIYTNEPWNELSVLRRKI